MLRGFPNKSAQLLVRVLAVLLALGAVGLTLSYSSADAQTLNNNSASQVLGVCRSCTTNGPLGPPKPKKISAPLLTEMSLNPTQAIPVIVDMAPPSAPFTPGINLILTQQAIAILNANGRAYGGLPMVTAAAGYSTAPGILAMSALPQVAEIELDAVVRPRRPATTGTPWPPGTVTSLYPQAINANRVWQQGVTGRGVTIAVLDSGIALDPDLVQNGNRVLAEVNFAGAWNPAVPDPGGHGSQVGGIIAGDGTRSGGQYTGVAPRANLVSVRVLDDRGNGRLSSIVAGIGWTVAHQAQYNIRGINMSFGGPTWGSYRSNALDAAVEMAWKRGMFVVAAAGNGGSGKVETPGNDPYVISVGAEDDHGTLTLADYTLAWFSAYGIPPDSTARPDLVAPGRKVTGIRVPGSTLDARMPDHVVVAGNGSTYFNLSGTSQAAGVMSGVAALMLERQPGLKPDQLKQILTGTTQPAGQNAPAPPPGSIGAGFVDAFAATNSAPRGLANRNLRPADSVDMTAYPLLWGQPLHWKDPFYLGINWALYTWATLPWSTAAWDNIAWDDIGWDNIAWDNIAWDNIAWDNIAWDNIAWDNSEWSNIAWDNVAWD